MPVIKLIRILLSLIIYIFIALFINIFTFGKHLWRLKLLTYLNHDLAITIRRIMNIRIKLVGKLSVLRESGNFIISNHLGYIDGIVLGSIFKIIYVSKAPVKSWPLFGTVANLGATVFVDREKKTLAFECTNKIVDLLQAKLNVLVFPEGTSTNGSKVLPFQALFFASPIQSKRPVIPINIGYTHINGREIRPEDRDKVCWYGQIPFIKHLIVVLTLKSIDAKIFIHQKIDTSGYLNATPSRHALANLCHGVISQNSFYPSP